MTRLLQFISSAFTIALFCLLRRTLYLECCWLAGRCWSSPPPICIRYYRLAGSICFLPHSQSTHPQNCPTIPLITTARKLPDVCYGITPCTAYRPFGCRASNSIRTESRIARASGPFFLPSRWDLPHRVFAIPFYADGGSEGGHNATLLLSLHRLNCITAEATKS